MIVPELKLGTVPAFEFPKVVRCGDCAFHLVIFSERDQVAVEKDGLGDGNDLIFYKRYDAAWGADRQIQQHLDIVICDDCLNA